MRSGCRVVSASCFVGYICVKLVIDIMKKIMYRTSGTCSKFIELEAEDGVLTRAVVVGGCHGNLQGICKLIVGMRLEDVKERLSGIRCGSKPTSCPDQIAKAIEELEKQ